MVVCRAASLQLIKLCVSVCHLPTSCYGASTSCQSLSREEREPQSYSWWLFYYTFVSLMNRCRKQLWDAKREVSLRDAAEWERVALYQQVAVVYIHNSICEGRRRRRTVDIQTTLARCSHFRATSNPQYVWYEDRNGTENEMQLIMRAPAESWWTVTSDWNLSDWKSSLNVALCPGVSTEGQDSDRRL